jgi:starch synthase (maltosyl-transferring)
MNQAPERAADVGLVLDILHSRRGVCGADWFVPARWNQAGCEG